MGFVFNQVSLLPGLSDKDTMNINVKFTNFHNKRYFDSYTKFRSVSLV